MNVAPPVSNNTNFKLTPKALEREARRLLPVMAKKGAHGRAGGINRTGLPSTEVSIVLRSGQKKPSAICHAHVLEHFRRQEWVEQDSSGNWHISATGLAWLVRSKGGEDGYRSQHQVIAERMVEMPDGSRRPVRINEGENPLGWLRRRKGPDGNPFITDDMAAAGDRLRTDFTLAQMTPSITTNWTRIQTYGPGSRSAPGNSANDLSDTALAARQRFTRAVNAVGPEMADIVVDVCCFLIGLGEAEKSRAWPQRSAKLVLRLALDILARHYGITGPRARNGTTPAGLAHIPLGSR